jgi:hypothetical protein
MTITATSGITLENLAQFYGSENMYFHPLFKGINYTEGVRFIGQNGANWLLVAILSHAKHNPKVKGEEFVVATLKVKDGSAILTLDDGNYNVLDIQEFCTTDFPLASISFYIENKTIMLPSER